MKSRIVKSILLIAMASVAACNFSNAGRVVDDAAPVLDEVIENAAPVVDDAVEAVDNVAPVVDDVVENAAPITDDAANLANNVARATFFEEISLIVQNEVDAFTMEMSNILTLEEQRELQRILKSTPCWLLNAHIEHRTLTEQDVLTFVADDIAGLRMYTLREKIAGKAITAYQRINMIAQEKDFHGAIYIAGVTLYCEVP